MPIDLQSELTELRRGLLTMAATVEQRVARVVKALLDRDMEAAHLVKAGDVEIDEMENEIEAECLRILALSHPVASDLRFVLAAMRINADLERIGDHAKSIAKRIIDLGAAEPLELPAAIREMAVAAPQMLHDAVAALADGDTDRGRGVRFCDEKVDDLQREVFAWVQSEIPRDVSITRAAIDMLSIARNFERIADLATNIAEDVVFVVEGSVIRHHVEQGAE